jgi:hypothetical protein
MSFMRCVYFCSSNKDTQPRHFPLSRVELRTCHSEGCEVDSETAFISTHGRGQHPVHVVPLYPPSENTPSAKAVNNADSAPPWTRLAVQVAP